MNPMAAVGSTSSAAGDIQLPEMPTPGMPGADRGLTKAFQSETEFLELVDPQSSKWVLQGVEKRVIELLSSEV
jgi:hypothetical protein